MTAMEGWERPDNAHAEAGWLVPTLTAGRGQQRLDDQQVGQLVPMAVSENQRGEVRLTPYARQITTGGGKPGQGYPAVAYPLTMRGRDDGPELEVGEADVYNALRAGDGSSSRQSALLTPELAVRRLTPLECERLMGWPDEWTRYKVDGTPIADSHRYRMCGNGVVSSVAEWIGHRIMEVHDD